MSATVEQKRYKSLLFNKFMSSMVKKIFIITSIFYLIVSFLPFKTKFVEYLDPNLNIDANTILTLNNNDEFIDSALNVEYTSENTITYQYAKDHSVLAPNINAQSALVVDLNKNEIIYAKNENEKRPIASLAKILTALIAVEHAYLDKQIVISEKAVNVGENSMNISKGEVYSLEDLLYGLVLSSGNDSAYAIAESIAGTEEEFVKWMNRRAVLLGATNSNFVDSSGLNKYDENYYSTAVDIAKIAGYSQARQSALKKIYSTFIKEIPQTENNKYLYLENQTNLLTTYPGVMGMKTGYTEEAGLCLVSYAENEGEKLLVVILNSSDRRGDAILLLDYGFRRLNVNVEHNLL